MIRITEECIFIGIPAISKVFSIHKWDGFGKSLHWVEEGNYYVRGFSFGFFSIIDFTHRSKGANQ